MYPQVTKENIPSAPPSYSETVGAQKYQPGSQQGGIYYPQHPYQTEPQVPTQVIVVQSLPIPPLGTRPVEVTCPTCKAVMLTSVEEESSTSAYLCCMMMFIIGCGLCSCLPFCMDNFKSFKHSCPSCGAYIGSHRPS